MDEINLKGMTLFDAVDALQKIEGHGIKSVIAVKIDGEPSFMTADYRPDRLQVETENNVIVNVLGRG